VSDNHTLGEGEDWENEEKGKAEELHVNNVSQETGSEELS
jgi:hypothetical protein